jgi:hypothetical protein
MIEENIGLKLLKEVIGASSKPRVEIAAYNGGLNLEELVDWINSMDKHFDFSEVPEDKKVKFAVTRLKGHALLWWDGVQAERRRLHKQPIKSWSRMIAKLKDKFLPRDYQLALYRQMQNLRQRLLTVREYTEEFYKVNIRAGYTEDNFEKVARYMNGLRFDIQDEMSLFSPKSVEEAYQCALKVEEKLNRRNNSGKGKVRLTEVRDHRLDRGKFSVQKEEVESSSQPEQPQKEGTSEEEDLFKEAEEEA